ncbi:MAG: universal stress protein [Vicinamibacteria bacterium]
MMIREIVHNALMELARILVPTDFSDAAKRAFEQALALARSGPAEILLLHRLPLPLPAALPPPADLGVGAFELVPLLDHYTKEAREKAEERLRDLARRARKGVRIETTLEEADEPYEAILRKASEWKADLVVMGTHGRRGIDKLLMGSVASAVLHRSEGNVMVLRADSELFALRATTGAGAKGSEPEPILVPVDFSEGAHRALALARTLVSRYQAHLHLLHVVELQHTPLEPGGLSSRFESSPELRGKYDQALRDMLGETEGEIHLAEGTVAGEILWWREKLGARLVVMGSRGLTGLKHLLMGSIAEKVSRFSEVPVLVVK